MNRYLARLRHICNWAIGRDLLAATAFHRRGVRIVAKNERRRERRVTEAEEQRLLDACTLLNEPPRGHAKLNWELVREIRARAQGGVLQQELAQTFHISQPLCSQIVRGDIWNASITTTQRYMNARANSLAESMRQARARRAARIATTEGEQVQVG